MIGMQPAVDAPAGPETAGRSSPFAAVQDLLAAAGPLDLAAWLRDLAGAFGARGAGFAGFVEEVAALRCWEAADGQPVPSVRWPWQEQPHLVAELSRTATAVALPGPPGTGGCLAAAWQQDGVSWLLWLEAPCQRDWAPDERAALELAVLALARRLMVGPGGLGWVERARRQQRLEEAAAVVRRLAHDFNNVLTGILGFTELGLAQAQPGSPLHQLLAEAYEAAQQGSRMVGQLTQFSRRSTSCCPSAALAPVVREVEKRFRTACGSAIDFRVELATKLPRVAADAEAIRLLLDQLLDNARQAVATGGAVELTARPAALTEADSLALLGRAGAGPHVEIRVADTGPGLSAEARQRLFIEPFFSTKPRHRGMGLATVYGILCACRGALGVASDPERGTVVRVYLPVAAGGIGPPAPGNDPAAGELIFHQPV